MFNKKKKIIATGFIFIFLLTLLSGCNETINISNDNFDEGFIAKYKDIFYCKKVIIRDDDLGASSYLPSVRWITELASIKDFKIPELGVRIPGSERKCFMRVNDLKFFEKNFLKLNFRLDKGCYASIVLNELLK